MLFNSVTSSKSAESLVKTLPVHLLKGLFHLTPEELNKKLLKNKEEYNFYNKKWSKDCQQNGIFFDLSQIRWVNMGAASLLALWIERAKNDGIQVNVALPYKDLTTKENDKIKMEKGEEKRKIKDLLNSNKEKRVKANFFLKIIQFDRAIKCEHIIGIDKKEVFISEKFEYQSERMEEKQFNKAFEEVYLIKDSSTDFSLFNYKYIVPLTWIDSHNVEQGIENLEAHFKKVLTNKEKGMEIFDVLALKNVLLSELLKNVGEHAIKATHGLLAIGLMTTKSLSAYQNDISKENKDSKYINSIEQNYIDWLFDSKFENFIEIYFGDSGVGILDSGLKEVHKKIHNNEDKLEVLNWAFDKWSTSKENESVRGTKGLYRIKRIVDKYEGIILIKTDNIIGGYQKGGYSFPSRWIDDRNIDNNIEIPGTFIQAKLCSYKDVIKFDFKFEVSQITDKQWISIFYELTKDNIERFSEWIRQQNEFKQCNTLLVLKFKENINFQTINDTLLNLKELSLIRQSNKAIVIYLVNDIGKDALFNIADSINQIIKKENDNGEINQEHGKPDFENVYSPVLLIGKEDNIFWFGENEDILLTLNEIYESHSINLNNLKYFNNLSDDKKQKVRHYFETDLIVSIDSDNNIIFNFNNIQSIFPKQIEEQINNENEKNQDRSPFCTPKLNVVNKWFYINKILERKKSDDLSPFFAFGLYLKFKEKYPNHVVSPKKTYILIDHSQQYNLAKEFTKLIGIDSANIVNIMEDIDYNIPRRTQLFERDDNVIIITTIISSSETIAKLIKYTKRDLAKPMVILSLIDKRDGEKTKNITIWGTSTDILSIYQIDTQNNYLYDEKFDIKKYTELLSQIEQCKTYISPNYEEEKKDKKDKEYEIDDEVKQHFIKNKAVHYNHIGNINGRHFTFYLDKQKILKDHSFIWDKFISKINNWIVTNNIKNFTLIIPQYSKEGDIWEGYVKYMKDKYNQDIMLIECWDVDKPNPIKESDNFVFLDFGALTGNTINKFIEHLKFPKKILIVILFSQFQDNGHEFYEKVKALKYSKTERFEHKQLDLFGDNKEETKIIIDEAEVEINFLYNLPIDVYNSSTCPICEHERMLEYYKMNNKYMVDFCEDRNKRLKIKSRKDTNEHLPYDFYYIEGDEKHTELSSRLIMKMFELKLLLKYAISNTQYRIEVFKQLIAIVENLEQQISDLESDLYAFLFLVSHEVLWFQREPLIFHEIRKIITEMAFNVAVEDLMKLTEKFSKNSNYDEKQCEKIAVRYKYAAITALRSADKSAFCKNVSKIIESSAKNDKKLSNNLIQNTFYHIHSLQFNGYNKSKKYFEDLKEQFKIIEKKSLFSPDHKQLSAFWDLKSMNETILKLLDIETKSISMATTFKHFQLEFLELYKTQGHPSFYESFTALDFRTLDPKAYPSYLKYKDKSPYYKQLLYKICELSNNWSMVNEIIIPIVNGLPCKIFQSDYFKSSPLFLDYFVNNKNSSSTIINLFSQSISTFNEEVLQDKDSYDRYHVMYDLIYKNLVEYKIEKNEDSRDSTLKRFLSDFDTNLKKSIDAIFMESDFQNLTSNINDSIHVFYPKTILTRFLKQIRENIKEKKNKNDKRLDDVSIAFDSKIEYDNDIKYTILTITNTGTHNYKKNFNPNGALYQFKEDLDCFGGFLDYYLDNELFVLKIKFLSYGE